MDATINDISAEHVWGAELQLSNCAGCGALNYTFLGHLGNRVHVRCRACGLDGSVEVK